MQYTEGRAGRVFILRLESGEILNDTIERFARRQSVERALVTFLGGAGDGSTVVVGPDTERPDTIAPLTYAMGGPREMLAVGTLIPDETGEPVLHMHGAAGREGGATVGCTRAGVEVWLVGEVVVQEILDAAAGRVTDPETGFGLLEAGSGGTAGASGAAGGD